MEAQPLKPIAETKAPSSKSKRSFWSSLQFWARWAHLYVSMFGFLTMFFFAITGITLNHPTWFGIDGGLATTATGKVPLEWVAKERSDSLDKLRIAEQIREDHRVRGRVHDFRIEEEECSLSFKGPGYSADVFLDRSTGDYEITIVQHGLVGKWNDLHKGRDSGLAWSVLIDASAIIMAVSSLTGVLMLAFMKKKRGSGFMAGIVGAILFYAVYEWLVP